MAQMTLPAIRAAVLCGLVLLFATILYDCLHARLLSNVPNAKTWSQPMNYIYGDALLGSAADSLLFGPGKSKPGPPSSDQGAADVAAISSPHQAFPPAPPNAGLPDPPKGAYLTQFKPCRDAPATIPMFVNHVNWPGEDGKADQRTEIRQAYIVQHGAGIDFDQYFSHVYQHLDRRRSSALLLAPAFYQVESDRAPKTWYNPSVNLAWESRINQWPVGRDAAAPQGSEDRCSSFDAFDTIIHTLMDTRLFPHLKDITFVGHSGGANMVSRYAQLNNIHEPTGFHIRYIVMNAANQAYFTDARPKLGASSCRNAFHYPYQLSTAGRQVPRYVANAFDAFRRETSVASDQLSQSLFQRWAARDVIQLTGDLDIERKSTRNCAAQSQGGSTRKGRMKAFWMYASILAGQPTAGTSSDDEEREAYESLIETGAHPLRISGLQFNHQNCIVQDVGHEAKGMLDSACGQESLFDQYLSTKDRRPNR